jgi:hypothetical protein
MVLSPARLVLAKRLFGIAAAVVLVAIASVAILAWGTAQWSPPSGGLSQGQAIQLAWANAGSGAVGIVSAEAHKDFKTGFDLPVHRWAWVVTFYGHWELLCHGSCDRTTEWVAVDYSTGEWIASQHSYPDRR